MDKRVIPHKRKRFLVHAVTDSRKCHSFSLLHCDAI